MKLHLPVSLRKSVIACILATAGIFPSISISAAGWGIAVCMLGSPSAKAEISTVTISASGKSELISTPDDSLIIMNLNRGHLYGSTTLNSSFEVSADMQIDSLIISDGFKLNTYHFSGDISGSGTFERTSDAKGANQTYVFTGDMSQYSGDMKFSRENDGNTFKFIGNQSGTGHITIAAGNSIAVDGAVMNNSSITSAGTFTVSGNSSFAGDVSSTGTLNVNGSASFEGDVYSNGSLVLGADAMLTNKGSFTFGEEASINLVRAVAAEDAQRTLTYTILSSAGTGTSNLSSLSLERIVGIQSVGRNWSFNDDGTLVGVLNNQALSYAGGNLTWNTTTAAFSNGSDTVAFTHGDDVTFSGNSSVTFGEALSAQRVTVANGAEVTISGGSGSLALAEAVVNGTLKLNKGGQNGAFSGNVDVYGTLSVETGDVTGWSGTDGIKSIDIFAGGEMYVGVSNNQTGAGLAINLQGGRISGVSGSNFDLGYGGSIYGYSSLSALAADTATAEEPTVSTISGTNLTLRQNHTTISVAENARLDISSGIFNGSGKALLNGEGAVPPHLQAGLVKTGAGELRLSGANTYTQATTVAEGTLTLTGGAALASSSVTVNDGAILHLATGSGLSASVSGILSGNGTLRKTGLGSASIGGLSDSFAGHIDLQQGTLSVGSPVVISSGRELSLGQYGAVLDTNLSLGAGKLSMDYSGSGAATSLNNSTLTLLGGTQLQLSSQGNGDGKTYELFSGISSLLGHDGSVLSLNSSNNAISNYFDTTRPGSGFWKEATLQFVDGSLQLVLHEGEVITSADSNGVTRITTKQSNGANYQYYAGLSFKNMPYSYAGGAIYGISSTPITLSYNGTIEFIENTADGGSALYGSTISLHHNGSVVFRNNSSVSSGAIYVNRYGKLELCDNGRVEFRENTVSSTHGGAIYADTSSSVLISNNGDVNFCSNSVNRSGGAIYGYSSTITLSDNESVTFSGNRAESSSYSAYGGAICVYYDSDITVSNNGSVTFSGNRAESSSSSACGGAIYGYSSTITLSDNESVTFSGNRAESSSSSACGGAIYGYSSTITLSDNESVTFSGNRAESSSSSAYGGAIYTSGNLSIRNNESVEFYQNAEANDGVYRLRSIYANAYGDEISLSAAAGKSIKFYDTVYISTDATVNLNQDYTYQAEDGTSITIKQQGDIVFTGAYAEQHLNDLLEAAGAGRTATAQEILNSRTTEVNTMTNLYGGRLRVEDGAIYQGCGITVHEGSAATVLVKNAELQHKGYDLTFHAGTTLELAGNNTIIGDVQMLEGSTLCFDGSETKGLTRLTGSLSSTGGADIALRNGSNWTGQNEILLYVDGAVSGWDDSYLGDNSDIRWVNGDLIVLNYNEETFKPLFNGDSLFTSRQTGNVKFRYYNSLRFDNLSYSNDGGAIYGSKRDITVNNNSSVTFSGNSSSDGRGGAIYGYSSTITLSDNESVTFSGNSATGSGGAICGYSSTITLSNNGSVTFSGNSATGSGGAICVYYDSDITLSNNGSVTFSGNRAGSSSSTAYGGAIYGYSDCDITVSNNGRVTFSGNRAESSSSSAYGGAIYTYGNLSIRNNDSVEFYQNAEANDGVYRLRSIYVNAYGDEISLSAAAGKSIKFYDTVYIGTGATVNLNQDYTYQAEDGTSITIKQQGDIVFTGAYAEQHLNDLLEAAGAGRTATAQEILNSRTTEVNTMTNLYGGRLRVEDGAIYQGCGITVHEGSAATVLVKNAELQHKGYDLTFHAGTTLELAGNNTISGNVQMLSDSNLVLDFESGMGEVYIQGDLSVSGSLIIRLPSVNNCYDTNTILLQVNGKCTDLMESRLAIQSDNYTVDDLFWGNNFLVINYDENTFNPFFNGSVTYSEQLTGVIGLSCFELLGFSLPSELGVSAILSDKVTLRNNGSIRFSDNTVVDSRSVAGGVVTCGAAISGQRIGGNVVLDGNREVLFERNIAGGRGAAEGGAIFNLGNSISGNERVVFIENAAIADSSWSAGGAIRGNLSLVRNKEVIFSGNKAQSGGSSAEGGAIFGWDIQLNENESLSFTSNAAIVTSSDSNSAVTTGGAIYALQNAFGPYVENRCLSICNNGLVLFAKNYELNKGNYRLRSIYVSDNGEGRVLISAAQGKRVEFRDSVYIGSENTLLLNADYTDAAENTIRQTGDIIFTGATTVDDLYTVKGNVDGTDEEIRLSRTSEIHTMTHLYGGRLRVEDGAVLKTSAGLTVAEGCNATVKIDNAELDAGTSDIAIGTTGTLELSNGAIVRANEIIIDDEATLALSCSELQPRATFALSEAVAAGTTAYNTGNTVVIDGDLTLNGGATLVADNAHFIMTEGSVLTFNASVEKKINLVLTLGTVYEPDVPIILFTGVESMRFIYNGTELTDSAAVNPGDFFTGAWINESTTFTYDAEAGTFFVMNVNSLPIPEPSTTTLGLLALACLAARRRRLD